MATLNNVIEGIKILSKYLPNEIQSREIGASHDKIYVGHEDLKNLLSQEDLDNLQKLGWFFDRESYSFAIIV